MIITRRSVRGKVLLILAAYMAASFTLGGCFRGVPPPDYKLNPNPHEKYVITITADGPLPPDIKPAMAYRIDNRKCIPLDYSRALGGVRLHYFQSFIPEMRLMSRQSAAVTVIADKILPDNYWGIGTCKWRISGVSFQFGDGSVGMSGEMIDKEAAYMWTCKPTRLKHPILICRVKSVYDKSGAKLITGVPQDSSMGLLHFRLTARRLSHDN